MLKSGLFWQLEYPIFEWEYGSRFKFLSEITYVSFTLDFIKIIYIRLKGCLKYLFAYLL